MEVIDDSMVRKFCQAYGIETFTRDSGELAFANKTGNRILVCSAKTVLNGSNFIGFVDGFTRAEPKAPEDYRTEAHDNVGDVELTNAYAKSYNTGMSLNSRMEN